MNTDIKMFRPVRLALAFIVLLFVVLTPVTLKAALREVQGNVTDQEILVIRSDILSTIARQPLFNQYGSRLLSTRAIQRACARYAHAHNLRLVYQPGNNSCVPLREYRSRNPKFHLNSTMASGQSQQQLGGLVQASSLLLISPVTLGAPIQCPCPTANFSPVVSVTAGSPQTSVAEAPITPIGFAATDDNNDPLTRIFSYTFNGATNNGLPLGLQDTCSASPGVLSCTISGTAPLLAGEYKITIKVSDGASSAVASAQLNVTLPVKDELIFTNGFESL